LSGWDVDVTLEPVHSFQDDAFSAAADADAAFWAEMRACGWAFLSDAGADYAPMHPAALPRTFHLQYFDNDVYRYAVEGPGSRVQGLGFRVNA
jgi:hypothetical protein